MRLVEYVLQCWRFFSLRSPRVQEIPALRGPEGEYGRRLATRAGQLCETKRRHQLLWIVLLGSAIATTCAAASALWFHLQLTWLLGPVTLLVWTFRRLTLSTSRYRELYAMVRFYECGLARLHSRWQGEGVSGEEYRPTHHLYAADLDLFGTGSVFEMLCTARTGIGRDTLARWLLCPASPVEIRARQNAIMELSANLDLQERWAAAGEADPSRVTSSTLAKWAQDPAVYFHPAVRVLAPLLPLLMLAVFLLRSLGLLGAHWLVIVGSLVALEIAVAGLCRKRVRFIARGVTLPSFELGLLAPLLDRFRQEPFCSPLLNQLQSHLSTAVLTSRREIARLRLWSWLLDLQQSEYFAAVCSLLLWKTNVAILVEGWRMRHCRGVIGGLEVVGQFEALLCFARYSFENPEHTFPSIAPDGPAFFHARSLGHPLLPASQCVPCDLSLDSRRLQIMILSGSNMSGKSTLLRAVGVNTVLAMAGAPVRASHLAMSPLGIGCSIAVRDSLLAGKSHFFVEAERLKGILASALGKRALVLLDEVLSGTNSEDRLFGTRAVLGRLLCSGAVVIVTTHDLALTELAIEFRGRASNAHFEETYENGLLRFDYKLRPGVITRTNGANVIAALGLL